MSETLSIWLFGIAGLWMLALTGIWNSMRQDMRTTRLAVKLFVDGMGKAAAEVLHSPDDHLGLDKYLDKYIAGHYDMSDADWSDFKTKCERLQTDKTLSDAERIAAGTVLAAFSVHLSLHKLSRIPPELRDKIEAQSKSIKIP